MTRGNHAESRLRRRVKVGDRLHLDAEVVAITAILADGVRLCYNEQAVALCRGDVYHVAGCRLEGYVRSEETVSPGAAMVVIHAPRCIKIYHEEVGSGR